MRYFLPAAAAATILAGALAWDISTARAGNPCCLPVVRQTLCVDDPCDPCPPFPVTVCVPACGDETPCVTWRHGAFGRRVAAYVWPSTGYSVEVVVTRRGEVIVRG